MEEDLPRRHLRRRRRPPPVAPRGGSARERKSACEGAMGSGAGDGLGIRWTPSVFSLLGTAGCR
jgi:hypothetical protein